MLPQMMPVSWFFVLFLFMMLLMASYFGFLKTYKNYVPAKDSFITTFIKYWKKL